MTAVVAVLAAIAVSSMLATSAAAADEKKSNVLAPGYDLPKGFTSVEMTEQPTTKWQQIDAIYKDPKDGSTIRFTTVRGSNDMAEPGRHPIDVCIRDATTGEVLLAPQIFGSKPMIEGCGRDEHKPKEPTKRYDQIINALDSLATVRFKPEYRHEFIALVNQAMVAIPDSQEQTEIGGALIIHRKNPELPPGETAPAQTSAPPSPSAERDGATRQFGPMSPSTRRGSATKNMATPPAAEPGSSAPTAVLPPPSAPPNVK